MMKTLCLSVALLALVPGLRAAEAPAPAAPAPEAPAAAPKPVIIDVRSQEEWDAGHIEGAIRITHDVIGSRIEAAVKDKSTPITVYCRSGRRAAVAKQTLDKMGYTKVENAGGYEDLKKKLAPKP